MSTEQTIEVTFADILRQDVDAIVNPANQYMLHGGGLAATIARVGGQEMVRESQALAPVRTGAAIHTSAGQLPFKAIFHTVGPVWEGDDSLPYWRRNSHAEDPDKLLAEAHSSVLDLMPALELTSVAFPAVSCGVFRFPVERAAPIAIQTVREGLERHSSIQRVVFCLLNDDHYDAFIAAST